MWEEGGGGGNITVWLLYLFWVIAAGLDLMGNAPILSPFKRTVRTTNNNNKNNNRPSDYAIAPFFVHLFLDR